MTEHVISSGDLGVPMTDHACIIRVSDGSTDDSPLFRAMCTCGWSGGLAGTEHDAQVSVLDHYSQTQGGLLSQSSGIAPTGAGHLGQDVTAAVPTQGSQETEDASLSPATSGGSPSPVTPSGVAEGGDAPSTDSMAGDTLPGPLMGTIEWAGAWSERYMARVYHQQPSYRRF